MSGHWGERFKINDSCVRHDAPACPSCLAYALGDMRARAEAAEKRAEEADGKLDAALNDIACGRRCEDELRADLAAMTKDRDEAENCGSPDPVTGCDCRRCLRASVKRLFLRAAAAESALSASRAEVDRLRAILDWVARNYHATLGGKSVRDADECLTAARSALREPETGGGAP